MYILALFLAVLGLHRYVRAFSSHCEWELLSSARASHCNDFYCGAWALGMETSVAAARRLQSGLSSCGTWASLFRGVESSWARVRIHVSCIGRWTYPLTPQESSFFPFFFFWLKCSDLQCCANFCCRAKWLSYTHIYILFWCICGLPGWHCW